MIPLYHGFFIGDVDDRGVGVDGQKVICGGEVVEGRSKSLDWADWMDKDHTITIDGDPSDWIDDYTVHSIGRGTDDVDLYMANDDEFLYICVDAKSDANGNNSVKNHVEIFFDGDNDNHIRAVNPNDFNYDGNEKDSFLLITSDSQIPFQLGGNGAGYIYKNESNEGELILLASIQGNNFLDLWNESGFYAYKEEYWEDLHCRVYEMKILLNKNNNESGDWNWEPGCQIGVAFRIFKEAEMEELLIGKYPPSFTFNDIGSWKDVYLATNNSRPQYSDPKATPDTILNNSKDICILTVEATDLVDNISEVVIDLTPIGGAKKAKMYDNGINGDAIATDDTYSLDRITAGSSVEEGQYNLTFTIIDDHSPNRGFTTGKIILNVKQKNRQPLVDNSSYLKIINLIEDQAEEYFNLTPIFTDPDGDILTYQISNDKIIWSNNLSSLANYSLIENSTLKVVLRPNISGNEEIHIQATDSEGLSVQHHIEVEIEERTDAPYIETINDSRIRSKCISLYAYEDVWSSWYFYSSDIDSEVLTYSINISKEIPSMRRDKDYHFYKDNGTLRINGKNSHVGTHHLNLTVNDINDGSDYLNILLTIINTNDPPSMEKIDTKYVDQDESLYIAPSATDEDNISGDVLVFSTNFKKYFTEDIDESVFKFNNSTGQFAFTPNKTMVRDYHTYIKVEDECGSYVQRNFTISVNNTNDPPEKPDFQNIKNRYLTVHFEASVKDWDLNDKLTFEWDFGDDSEKKYPVKKSIANYTNCFINHTYQNSGKYTVELIVRDSAGKSNFCSKIINVTPHYKLHLNITYDEENSYAELNIQIMKEDWTPAFPEIENEDGLFVTWLPAGTYHINVSKSGYRNVLIICDLTEDMKKVIVLKRKTTDSGDENGKSSPSSSSWIFIVIMINFILILFGIAIIILVRRKKAREKDENEIKEEEILPELTPITPQYVIASTPKKPRIQTQLSDKLPAVAKRSRSAPRIKPSRSYTELVNTTTDFDDDDDISDFDFYDPEPAIKPKISSSELRSKTTSADFGPTTSGKRTTRHPSSSYTGDVRDLPETSKKTGMSDEQSAGKDQIPHRKQWLDRVGFKTDTENLDREYSKFLEKIVARVKEVKNDEETLSICPSCQVKVPDENPSCMECGITLTDDKKPPISKEYVKNLHAIKTKEEAQKIKITSVIEKSPDDNERVEEDIPLLKEISEETEDIDSNKLQKQKKEHLSLEVEAIEDIPDEIDSSEPYRFKTVEFTEEDMEKAMEKEKKLDSIKEYGSTEKENLPMDYQTVEEITTEAESFNPDDFESVELRDIHFKDAIRIEDLMKAKRSDEEKLVNCPSCREEVDPDTIYCEFCGMAIIDD